VAALYAYERRVIPPRLGQILTALRSLALVLLMIVMLQPLRVWSTDRNITRRVVVLMDDSESMHFVDQLWTTSEMVQVGLQADLLDSKTWPLPALDFVSDWSLELRPWTRTRIPSNEVPPELVEVLSTGGDQARELQKQLDELLAGPEGDAADGVLSRMQGLVRDGLVPAFAEAQKAASDSDISSGHLQKVSETTQKVSEIVDAAREAADERAWQALTPALREAVERYCTTTRYALGAAVLTDGAEEGKALLDRLADRYEINLMRLGDGLELLQAESLAAAAAVAGDGAGTESDAGDPVKKDVPTAGDISLRSLTDYATALETIIKDVPSEELAGVLIVSDGQNNGAAGLKPIGRRFGLQGVPVSGVVVGGSRAPKDLAIAEVKSPESIFLGDRVRMSVTVRVTGAKGSKVNLMMSGVASAGEGVTNVVSGDGQMVLDKALIDVLTDDYTHEVRLTHEPKEHGMRSYSLWTEELDGELFTSNNTWEVDVAVSDDRTNVLLVDDRPRWEYRYLRNLFFGRDKSVHLQYYLSRPDRVAGVETEVPLAPASASRKFGDAEAGSLPISRDEWRKFDMIIIGDVDAETLTPEVLEDIRHCVSERGSVLVVIAGRRHMPGAFDDEVLTELLPVTYGPVMGNSLAVGRLRSRLVMTGAGGNHAIMQQSGSYSENVAIWDEMQPLTWRFEVSGVKPGAEILAYARPTDEIEEDMTDVDVTAAAARLDDETGKRARNALIVAQKYGRGKVLMLNLDETWRLRHKVGDTLHHKFWGQVMRWGVGEKLRAGEEGLRLGTDKVIYTPRETPRVLARVTDEEFVGVIDAKLEVTVTHGDTEVARVTPVYREGSHGMYEVALPPCAEPGRYELLMTRKDLEDEVQVRTAFMVVTAKRSVELSDVRATRRDLGLLAGLTGGRVLGPARAEELWDAFGEGGTVVAERNERTLWDRPWILFCLLGLLTTEWLLRKRGGLT